MKEYLISNWIIILIGLGFLGYIVYLIVKRRWAKLRSIAYKLIRQAEVTIIGTKKGRDRFDQVITQLYSIIPIWIRIFISRSFLEEKLQEWYNVIKDSLDDGKINNSTKPPKPPDTILK
jgi:hypothetical protein